MDQPARQPFPFRRWALCLYWLLMFLGTHLPRIDRYGPDWDIHYLDKLLHGAMYAGWIAVWWWLLSRGGRRVSRAMINWLLVGGFVYAVFDELTQSMVGRTTELGDLAADVIGMVLATIVLQRRQQRRSAA